MKRSRLKTSLGIKLLASCYWLFSIITNTQTLLKGNSINENLMALAIVVSVGQPVLLDREVGVGMTILVMEWVPRTEVQEKAFTLNISKDLSTIHKPSISHESSGLQVGRLFVPLSSSPPFLHPVMVEAEDDQNDPLVHSLKKVFTLVVLDTFYSVDNKFLGHLDTCFMGMCWSHAMQLMSHLLKVGFGLAKVTETYQKLELRRNEVSVEMTTGQEMSRKTTSVLECLSQLLERDDFITLYEAEVIKSISRDKDFRLFPCMNPDAYKGEADLATGVRIHVAIYSKVYGLTK